MKLTIRLECNDIFSAQENLLAAGKFAYQNDCVVKFQKDNTQYCIEYDMTRSIHVAQRQKANENHWEYLTYDKEKGFGIASWKGV